MLKKIFWSAEKNITTLKHFLNELPFLGAVSYQTTLKNKIPQHHIDKQKLINSLSIKK